MYQISVCFFLLLCKMVLNLDRAKRFTNQHFMLSVRVQECIFYNRSKRYEWLKTRPLKRMFNIRPYIYIHLALCTWLNKGPTTCKYSLLHFSEFSKVLRPILEGEKSEFITSEIPFCCSYFHSANDDSESSRDDDKSHTSHNASNQPSRKC